ncbi:ferredoxin [Melissococcus plutonius]|uniref:Ferredoxin n=2 Tax=Melissococcus plutonius TaxID=33970 RepID=A0A2Z5Y2H3_9ENTE|nr:ferredoxin [Melissococcus plutonius]
MNPNKKKVKPIMQCEIIREKCIACGLCQIYAPTIFDYTDDGVVMFKDKLSNQHQETIPITYQQQAINACHQCPVRAILIDK